MKKLKTKLSLNQLDSKILNQLELKQLKGGDDIYNTNSIHSCTCEFNNNSVIYNQNSEFGCTCRCTL